VVTGDEGAWQAFFALRCHELADPKIQRIAEMIWAEIEDSVPVKLQWGDLITIHKEIFGKREVGDRPDAWVEF
jgi:thymidylate synthase ThyX